VPEREGHKWSKGAKKFQGARLFFLQNRRYAYEVKTKGPFIKDNRSQEEGVCPVRTFFGQEVRG